MATAALAPRWWANHFNQHCPALADPEPNTSTTFSRLLLPEHPRLPWRQRKAWEKSSLHWGQRKLFLSELEFLTQYGVAGDLVVYAGAAPGIHLDFLASLFPAVRFILVDPEPFKCRGDGNIRLLRGMFTDELAGELAHLAHHRVPSGAGTPGCCNPQEISPLQEHLRGFWPAEKHEDGRATGGLLFLSDIRTADFRTMSEEESEGRVLEDLRSQWGWLSTLSPRASMLKFRLPYLAGETRYPDGDVYLPVWGRQSTTECRLVLDESHRVVDPGRESQPPTPTPSGEQESVAAAQGQQQEPPGGYRTRLWDHSVFGDHLFWFNCRTRVARYAHPIRGVPGLCHCYDCASEISIVRDYLLSLITLPELPASFQVPMTEPGWDCDAEGRAIAEECCVHVPEHIRAHVVWLMTETSSQLSRTGRTLAHAVNFWRRPDNSRKYSMSALKAQLQDWPQGSKLDSAVELGRRPYGSLPAEDEPPPADPKRHKGETKELGQ